MGPKRPGVYAHATPQIGDVPALPHSDGLALASSHVALPIQGPLALRTHGAVRVATRLLHPTTDRSHPVSDFVFAGSGTEIRTLNLAVNRSLRPLQK
jgi:hypothetical protein